MWLAVALASAMVPVVAQAQFAPTEVQAAIRSARMPGRDLREFYRARSFQPLWIRSGELGPEADTFLRLVESAGVEGLDPGDYRPGALADEIEAARRGPPAALARAEILLTRRFAQYVRDVRRPPRRAAMIYAERGLAPVRPTARAVLERAARAPSLAEHFDTIGWMHPIYGRLRNALAADPGIVRAPSIQIPPGPTLREGSTGERVRMLRARLGLDPDGPFDADVARALRDFQGAHGLPRDALAGPLTLAALNGGGSGESLSPEQRRTLLINLARARSLPAEPPSRYILVDAAAARLWTYENGRVRDTMRVVVGRVTDQTPMIAGMIRYATLNPYWNVPPDLVASRIAPNVLDDGMPYLRGRGYEVLSDWSGNPAIIDPQTIDWAAVAAGQREIRVRQRPGPSNAMGRMKFQFPNNLGVYLHDTPERDLLRETARQFSAGCVRVEDAPRLARWLFGRMPTAPSRAPEQQVPLPSPVAVYITYLTAAPDGDRIAFREDVYGRDSAQRRQSAELRLPFL